MGFIKRVIKKRQIKRLTKKNQIFRIEGKFISQDNITMELEVQLDFYINNMDMLFHGILMEDIEQGLKDIMREIIKEEIKKINIGEIWNDFMEKETVYKEKYQTRLQHRMEERLFVYGVSVNKLELLICELPDDLKEAWQKMKKLQAERERIMREKEIKDILSGDL